MLQVAMKGSNSRLDTSNGLRSASLAAPYAHNGINIDMINKTYEE
jgi:hypothetical protein